MTDKFGTPIDKGVVLTTEDCIKNEKLFQKYGDLFLSYPDLFIDLITPSDSMFKLFFYQRMFLRATLRYRYHYAVFTRAFSKSFISILALFLRCMFLPRSTLFLCAGVKEQGVKIAREKINEILSLFPILEHELSAKNMSNDYIRLVFKNGSVFDVVGILNSTRGGRRTAGLIEEVASIEDGDTLNETVLPLMNINRRSAKGIVYPDEPHQAQNYVTTAGYKSTFAYERLIELLVMSVILPHNAFVWGGDYRIPIKYGLLSAQYISEIRLSSTYKEESFAREYMSVWTGGSSEAWVKYDRINAYRKIVNSEKKEKKVVGNNDVFYIISVDVARSSNGAQSVAMVFKVMPKADYFVKKLVHIYVHTGNMHFEQQAIAIKKLIEDFNAYQVIIDGNGLGAGLLDFMTIPNIDMHTGKTYGPIGSFNDKELAKSQPKDCPKLIYVIKANDTLDSEVHTNCYTQLNSGRVRFLIEEAEAKNRLMATKVGQKMKIHDKVARLMPYELTTRLIEELCNMRPKPNANLMKLERINTRMTKDKFSAFEYGLFLIKIIEDKYYKSKRRKQSTLKDCVFYTTNN